MQQGIGHISVVDCYTLTRMEGDLFIPPELCKPLRSPDVANKADVGLLRMGNQLMPLVRCFPQGKKSFDLIEVLAAAGRRRKKMNFQKTRVVVIVEAGSSGAGLKLH
jgi:hypothetical protein